MTAMVRSKPFDLSVYLVTDRAMAAPRSPATVAAAAAAGGATMVQLREKRDDTDWLVAEARVLKAALAPHGVPLIVNDRPDVALAAGADGVHVGQGDISAAAARDLLGPAAIIGISVAAAADLETVDPTVVDYVGLGPVFPTPTKPDGVPLPPGALRSIRARLPLPVVAIGGLTADNLADAIAAGCDGVAVVSAICAAADPRAAAAGLRTAVRAAKGETR